MNLELRVFFPGAGDWTDLTHLVRHGTKSVTWKLMNDDRKSVVDSFRVQLKHDNDLVNSFFAYDGRILAQVTDEADVPVFTGYVAPTFEQTAGQVVTSLSIELLDNSYLLDETLAESFQYPATIGSAPYKILDSTDPDHSIIHQLLEMAGYPVPGILSGSCPDITETVLHIAGTKGEETYRELIDGLLFEHGYVFAFTEAGTFTVHHWDADTVTPTVTIQETDPNGDSFGTAEGLSRRKRDIDHDGAEVEWSQPATMEDALLYRENLPLSTTGGKVEFTGQAIAAGDYFPADGDIEDTFQSFVTQWLDIPYLERKTRLRNKDISLITTSDHAVAFTADTGVGISSQTFESHRAKVLFQNTAAETKKLYTFEITGKALYRKAVKKRLAPSTSTNPRKYTARHLYNSTAATRLTNALWGALHYGDFEYTWTMRGQDLPLGTVVTINLADPSMSTTAIVISVGRDFDRPMRSYTAIGISAYETFTSVVSGGQGVDVAAQQDLVEKSLSVMPTFADLQDGYTEGGGTTIPTVPTVPTAKGVFKGAYLVADVQPNLTNFSHFEWQVSEDESDWYSLKFDLTDWKDVLDAVTEWPTVLLTHPTPLVVGGDGTASGRVLYYRVRRATKSAVVSGWSDVATVTTLAIDAGDYVANSVATAVLQAGAVTAEKIKAGEITARELAFADDAGAPVFDGWDEIPAGSELFDLRQPDCVSSLGRKPYAKVCSFFPGKGRNQVGTEYSSPHVRFSGLGAVGTFVGTTNVVQSPENWTDTAHWTASSATVSLSSEYFQDRRFSLLTAAGSSSGCVYQSFAAGAIGAAGSKSTSVTIKKGSGNARVGMYDWGVGWIFLAMVTWSTKTVSFTAGSGTITHQKWWGDDIVELSITWTLTNAGNEHRLYAYGGTVDGNCNYYTAAQVESRAYATPYTPTTRAEAGGVSWKITAALTGTVEFWYRPWFNYDTGANRYLWLWGASASGLSSSVWLRYLQSGDNFEALIYLDGSNYRKVEGATIPSNAALWKWWHFKIIWDIPNQSIRMWIDGTEQTTTSSAGTVSGMTPQQELMQVGFAASAGANSADGLFADLLLQPSVTTDTSATHFTGGVPWYDPGEVANVVQSVRISKAGIRLHNAALGLTDDWNRSIEISPAAGMLAKDAAGRIIHDIPTGPLAAASYAMGHYYHFEEYAAIYTLVSLNPFTETTWMTVQAVSAGHANVKGVRLKFILSGIGTASTLADARIVVRPTDSGWGSALGDMAPSAILSLQSPSAIFGTTLHVGVLDVPVNDDLQFDYYAQLNPDSSTRSFSLIQVGVWI